MRYFALYQREFSGMPKQLEPNSHVLVAYTSADSLEDVFNRFQSETMTEKRRRRIMSNPVRHTSMSVGYIVIGENGFCHAVMPIGFAEVEANSIAECTELALHLLALSLEASEGWTRLFEREPAQLAFSLAERLRTDVYGVASRARTPYATPPQLEVSEGG